VRPVLVRAELDFLLVLQVLELLLTELGLLMRETLLLLLLLDVEGFGFAATLLLDFLSLRKRGRG
jgi:hypothetical protein